MSGSKFLPSLKYGEAANFLNCRHSSGENVFSSLINLDLFNISLLSWSEFACNIAYFSAIINNMYNICGQKWALFSLSVSGLKHNFV